MEDIVNEMQKIVTDVITKTDTFGVSSRKVINLGDTVKYVVYGRERTGCVIGIEDTIKVRKGKTKNSKRKITVRYFETND